MLISEYKTNHSKTRDLQELREDMLQKLSEKNSEMRQLELEIQRLLSENQSLINQNEDLTADLEHLRATSMSHLENMERELQTKYKYAQDTENQLKELQEEFL